MLSGTAPRKFKSAALYQLAINVGPKKIKRSLSNESFDDLKILLKKLTPHYQNIVISDEHILMSKMPLMSSFKNYFTKLHLLELQLDDPLKLLTPIEFMLHTPLKALLDDDNIVFPNPFAWNSRGIKYTLKALEAFPKECPSIKTLGNKKKLSVAI